MSDCAKLSKPEAADFRHSLRVAREACARDAEAFDEVLFAVERLGIRLYKQAENLGKYKACLSELARKSALVAQSAEAGIEGRPYFPSLFQAVQEGRNNALHQGAVARHLTSRVIELALILEDALAIDLLEIRYLMVKSPVVASEWQTLAAVRQLMLANAFSYLPICWKKRWCLISDHALAGVLGRASDPRAELAKSIETVAESVLPLPVAPSCVEDTPKHDVVKKMTNGEPVLVLSHCQTHLMGLVAPADVL